jgi:uncharacterized protein YoxC
MSAQDFMWLALGVAALIIAIALAFISARLGKVLDRTQDTLGKVEHLLDQLEAPITTTLDHVGGVAGNVDSMVTRVNHVTELLERATLGIAKAADAAQAAVSPAVANVVGVVAGVSRGAQAFFRSRHGNGSE